MALSGLLAVAQKRLEVRRELEGVFVAAGPVMSGSRRLVGGGGSASRVWCEQR
jgi:hypothetical protein